MPINRRMMIVLSLSLSLVLGLAVIPLQWLGRDLPLLGLDVSLAQPDMTPPTIVSVTPPPGATGVPTDQVLQIVFSEPVTAAEFNLRLGSTVVLGQFSGRGTNTLTFTPQFLPLSCNATYSVFVNGIYDLAIPPNPFNGVDNVGDGSANDYNWTFQTGCGSMPDVGFVPANYSGNEGAGSLNLTVQLAEPSTVNVTVGYQTVSGTAIAGSDFVSAPGSLVFMPGQTSQTIPIGLIDDVLVETDEQFQVMLNSVQYGVIVTSTAVVTILDNDLLPVLNFNPASYTVDETASSVNLTVTLNPASPVQVTVDYTTTPGTATAGLDYTSQSGTLTFAPNQTSQSITIDILNDLLVESAETFQVVLNNPQNGAIGVGTADVTINDDDTPIVVTLLPATAVIPTGTAVAFTATVAGGAPPYNYTWNFGAGPIGSQNVITTYTFTAPGDYTVAFVATDQMAQSGAATSAVRVGNPPVAAFTPSSTAIMAGDSVQFVNNSTGTPPLQFQWNFGDGNTSMEQSPTHTFALPGIFQVVLTVQNDFGSASASATIQVSPTEAMELPFDAFNVARSIIYWHEGNPEPADYWIFGTIDFPGQAGLDSLTRDLTFRVEIAGSGDDDTVSLVELDGGLSFHERYSTGITGQEIRDVFIHPISNDQAIFVIAGQFLLPGINRQIQPPDVSYRLSLPAMVGDEVVHLVGSTVITHQSRSNIWVYRP